LSQDISDISNRIAPSENAKLFAALSYALSSLYWTYLRATGVNPLDHPLKTELERVKTAMMKIEQAIKQQLTQEVELMTKREKRESNKQDSDPSDSSDDGRAPCASKDVAESSDSSEEGSSSESEEKDDDSAESSNEDAMTTGNAKNAGSSVGQQSSKRLSSKKKPAPKNGSGNGIKSSKASAASQTSHTSKPNPSNDERAKLLSKKLLSTQGKKSGGNPR